MLRSFLPALCNVHSNVEVQHFPHRELFLGPAVAPRAHTHSFAMNTIPRSCSRTNELSYLLTAALMSAVSILIKEVRSRLNAAGN